MKNRYTEVFKEIFLAIFPTVRHYCLFVLMILFTVVMSSSNDKYIVLISSIGAVYCLNEFSKREGEDWYIVRLIGRKTEKRKRTNEVANRR
jgi:hypothetical protein